MKILNLPLLMLIALINVTSFITAANYQYPPDYDSLKIIEKVYLHIDRDSYYPGDDIWFKAYLVDASDRFLCNHSSNLHVELISSDLKIIDNSIVKLNEGLGNGDFRLPEKLPSGRYRIRAYTNYMRNFGDQLFFNKDIMIINPSDSVKALSDSTVYNRNKFELSFFPEGGSLVDNVPSFVAFKVVNGSGVGIDVTGEVYSSTGELVTIFKSIHKGLGKFLLTPLPGISYYTLFKNPDGDLARYEIPKSFSTGVILNVSKNLADEISLIFKTNTETLPMILDSDLSLTVSVRNSAIKTFTFRMKSLNSFLNLPFDDLPEGIVMFTLSGLNNLPLCERLIYLQNNEDVKINLETNKKVYNQRDSVSVKISLRSDSRIPQDAFLSLSATDNIFRDNSTKFPSTISSCFLLESDLRGPIEEPSYYFDPSNPDRLKDLDLLLLTQGWRDFEWKYKNMKFQPENGFTISGRVRKKFADVPVSNSIVNIGIFNSGKPLVSTVPTDSSGRFCLKGVDLTGSAKLIASVTGDNDKLKGWLLLDSVKYSPAITEEKKEQTKFIQNNDQFINENQSISDSQLIKKTMHKYIQYAEIKNSIRRKYKLSDTIKPGEVTITAKRKDWTESAQSRSRHYLMGTPDKEVIITPQLEIYNNAYQLVNARFLGHTKLVGLAGASLNPKMMNPLYMIDGVKVMKEDVMSLPLSWVERIDILDNPASYSVFGYSTISSDTTKSGNLDGVISIILRNDHANNYSPVFHSVNIKFTGYNEPRVFYSPKHHTTLESDYKPDLRTTLLWEPDIKVENNKNISLSYFNSDNPSKITVVVEGITTNGIPVTGKTEYEVK